MATASGERSAAAGGSLGFANTGDHNLIQVGQVVTDGAAPAARSAYWEQVSRIAPETLVERDRELEELIQFCAAEDGPSYGWWRAEAWAGKTALLAWFALHPPQGVRVVPFFITARLGAYNDRLAYVDVVLEQLAEIVGEGLPAYLTGPTREAHLLRLYGAAARTCAQRGQRLVLLVDGLDEDRTWTTSPDAHSIASLLPHRLEAGMRVIVAGRPHPPVPGDVPTHHPLRDPGIVRPMEISRHAQIIREEAERELKVLLADNGLQHDLLGLVTVAAGGLTASDLAELTDATPYRVKDTLRSHAGRTFAVRAGHTAEVYLLAHEGLQHHAAQMLGETALSYYRHMLHEWAAAYAARDWPAGTPEYLLRGYFPMLRADGDLQRVVACALDAARHDRMLDVTFGDAVASDEIRVAEELIVHAGVPDLLDMVRLAIRREALDARNDRVGSTLPWAWAALGRPHRAGALARSIPTPDDRALALARVAEELVQQADIQQAIALLEQAEAILIRAEDLWEHTDSTLVAAVAAWTCAGRLERAEHLVSTVGDVGDRRRLLPELVQARVHAGAFHRAEALALGDTDPVVRTLSMASLLAAHAETGHVDDARARARASEPAHAALALARVASVLHRSGQRDAAEVLWEETEQHLPASGTPAEVIAVLAREGEFVRARNAIALLTHTEDRDTATYELLTTQAAAGEHEDAAALARTIEDPGIRSAALRAVVEQLVCSEGFEQAQRIVGTINDDHERHLAHTAIVGGLAGAGHFDEAEAYARRHDHPSAYPPPAHSSMCEVVEALAAAGEFARAEELARTIIYHRGFPALAHGAVAAAANGRLDRAVQCLVTIEAELRSTQPTPGARDFLYTAQIMADAGQTEAATMLIEDAAPLLTDLKPGGPAADFAAFDQGLLASAVAETLLSMGETGRAEALLRQTNGGMAVLRGWPRLVRQLVRDGEVERAEAVVDLIDAEFDDVLRAEAVVELAQAGAFDTARAWAGRVRRPESCLHAWVGLAAALAAAGDTKGAWSALAKAEALRTDSPMQLAVGGSLLKAYAMVGEHEKADQVLQGVAALGDQVPFFCSGVVDALVELEQYDRAEDFVQDITSQGDHEFLQAGLVKAFVSAGEYGRAQEAARSIPVTSRSGVQAAVILAPVVAPGHGRALAAHALRHGSLSEALPAVLQLEPEAAALVVESLRTPGARSVAVGDTEDGALAG
ncbi:hypothetical protein [Streptomyces ochraceiscleroticus]|uniref:NACHT domain-containing protein n=1 Tax=Streptomyces ochraceiscleroticus TaxID=47761 RepID=A0ABW1MMA8_9ACTN|nr:hypothetical protein [Streptomyces ochraceiscleroticus]